MQNKRALLISLGVALFAVLMIYSYISQKEKTLLELATPIRVVVAIRDIPEGSKLDENVVEERQVPRKYVQPGAISELSMAVDKTVIVPVLKGTQILESVLMSAGGSLAAKVPTGMRAFSCAVTDVTAAAGLIRPGDFVDVMVTVETGHFQEGKTISDEIMTRRSWKMCWFWR